MTEVDIILSRKNFDIEIQERFSNGITGIFGPSGAGKTSLLHSIAGLSFPNKGFISIENKVVFDSERKIHIPVEKRNIGYVFQEGRLFPHMSIEKNLTYGMKKRVKTLVSFDETVELLQLQSLLGNKPSQISGGERQRVALGRALLSSPDILLLDEPFSAVDIHLRKQILPFIINIHRHVHIPILVVSHDLPDLLKLTSTLCVIKEGKCVGHGPYYDLLKNKPVSELLGTHSLINTIETRVIRSIPDNELTVVGWKEGGQTISIKSNQPYYEGQNITVFIHADDIALSTEKFNQVTIQNQLKGTVTNLIERPTTLLCMVDIGVPLLVEITKNAQKHLEIEQGKSIWCLFKSVAIEVTE